jgi:hypothetical protein
VTARLVRPEARGVFVSTNGLEFDFPEIPLLGGRADRGKSNEPATPSPARVRGAIDFPRAGIGASAGGLERVDGGDAPVRVTVRELGVKARRALVAAAERARRSAVTRRMDASRERNRRTFFFFFNAPRVS